MEYLIKKSRLEVSLCFQTGLAYYLKGLLLFDYNFIVLLFSLNLCILRRIHHSINARRTGPSPIGSFSWVGRL